VVQLRSGGYIVINPTEALVSIDVNSGKSTRERNIEETAYKTNLEAADEVARQLRLRDLAGLIVIDFIDMEEARNNASVERRMKEAMKNDRARIQLGRISAFGLLELSRQRLRPSLLETNFERCPHCSGTGVIRSVESASLHILRAIEEEGIRKRSAEITIYVPTQIALYILNQKRAELTKIEERHGFHVMVQADDTLIAPDHRLERNRARLPDEDGPLVSADRVMAETDRALAAEPVEDVVEEVDVTEAVEAEDEADVAAPEGVAETAEAAERRRRRRRRRGRGRGEREDGRGETAADGETDGDIEAEAVDETAELAATIPADSVSESGGDAESDAEGDEDEDSEDEGGDEANDRNADGRKKRRRGKRGGRRRTRRDGSEITDEAVSAETVADDVTDAPAAAVAAPAPEVIDFDEILAPASEAPVAVVNEAPAPVVVEETPAKKPTRKRKTAADAPVEAPAAVVDEAPAPKGRRKAPAKAAEAPVNAEAPAKKAPARKRKTAVEAPVEAPAAVVEAPAPKGRRKAPTKAAEAPVAAAPIVEEAPAKKAPARKRKTAIEAPVEAPATPAAVEVPAVEAPAPTPVVEAPVIQPPAAEEPAADAPAEKTRRGWWRR
jgi:ribonuclease E